MYFFVLFAYVTMCLLLAVHNIFCMPLVRYSLFVLKVPLNTNQSMPVCLSVNRITQKLLFKSLWNFFGMVGHN